MKPFRPAVVAQPDRVGLSGPGPSAPNGPAWYRGGLYHDNEPFAVPDLWFNSWFNIQPGPIALFNHARQHGGDAETRPASFLGSIGAWRAAAGAQFQRAALDAPSLARKNST
jgi:predicted acyl esterase